MKRKTTIYFLSLSLLLGILYWLVDSILAYVFLKQENGTFLDQLIFGIDPHHALGRAIFIATCVIGGFIVAAYINKKAESEEKFQNLFENMSSCVAVYESVNKGEDFIFTDFNAAGERVEKVKREDIIGKRVTQCFPGVREFGLLDVFKRVWETGEPEHHPISLYKDERLQGWKSNYVYKLQSGEVVAVYDDVTDEKKVEEELRIARNFLNTVIESFQDPLMVIDRDYNVVLANQAAINQAGGVDPVAEHLKCHEVAYRRNCLSSINSDEFCPLKLIIETKKPTQTTQSYQEPDGNQRWVEIDAFPIFDDNNDVSQIVEYCRDITERKRTETELEQYRNHLEEVINTRTSELQKAHNELLQKERMATLGQLVAIVSHELRNPLGTIASSIYTIKERLEDIGVDVTKPVDRAERNIKRCVTIIEELLDFRDTGDALMEPTDVDEWLKDTIAEQDIPDGISVRQELSSNKVTRLDRERIRRCVFNVVTNACQAVLEKRNWNIKGFKPQVTIKSHIKNNRLKIIVNDNGIGISPDELEKIFEPLYSTKNFGVGLGLPITKQIMEKHDGGVELTSIKGEGTTMTLWLPLDDSELSER